MKKIFSPEAIRPKACILSVQQYYVVEKDPGAIGSHTTTMGKTHKRLYLRNHESKSLFIVRVAMSSNPHYKIF